MLEEAGGGRLIAIARRGLDGKVVLLRRNIVKAESTMEGIG
jgi:hypothetical protein